MCGEPILIVDDNLVNLKLARVLLTAEGFEVRTATAGEEALAVLEEFRPRMILLDIQLPGMDGLELMRRLKADPRMRDVVIVALTAYAMKGDEERVLALGVDAYLSKPIDTRRLAVQVADLLAWPAKERVAIP